MTEYLIITADQTYSCGSSSGSSEVYAVATRSVGKAIADAGRMLVYGGGSRGLMGMSFTLFS